jgi:hypothetical protein
MDLEKNFIAIYAALLSTFTFIWNIWNSKPKFTVEIVDGIEKINGQFKAGVYIFIKNPSPHKVNVTSISLVYPYKNASLFEKLEHVWKYKNSPKHVGWVHTAVAFKKIKTGLPVSIEPRNSHSIFIPEKVLQETLSNCIDNKFAAIVHDALWRSKRSRTFKILH